MLRELRRAAGLKQKTVAARLGVDISYVSRVESDKLRPAREYVAEWAELLGTDPDVLFVRFGYLPPDLGALLVRQPNLIRDFRELCT